MNSKKFIIKEGIEKEFDFTEDYLFTTDFENRRVEIINLKT